MSGTAVAVASILAGDVAVGCPSEVAVGAGDVAVGRLVGGVVGVAASPPQARATTAMTAARIVIMGFN
ncbi:MAG: hypothetical protein O2783_04145 [Chloroflexi bacterium]|nr:hypothetical protein [Chloroflexota bacterium]